MAKRNYKPTKSEPFWSKWIGSPMLLFLSPVAYKRPARQQTTKHAEQHKPIYKWYQRRSRWKYIFFFFFKVSAKCLLGWTYRFLVCLGKLWFENEEVCAHPTHTNEAWSHFFHCNCIFLNGRSPTKVLSVIPTQHGCHTVRKLWCIRELGKKKLGWSNKGHRPWIAFPVHFLWKSVIEL